MLALSWHHYAKEALMPKRIVLALALATLMVGPASAQDNDRGGVRTETQDRIANQQSGMDLIWNVVGLLGLLGLLGLRKGHEEDSYHPAPLE
jgi:hypothetical protein